MKEKKFKILLITNMYPSRKSYLGTFIKKQVDELEKIGFKITKVKREKNSSLAYIPFFLKTIFHLLFSSYDLVHTHYGFHSALFPSLIKRKPIIITFHGSDALEEPFRNIFYFYLQKFVILRSDHIISVSKEIKDKLIFCFKANPKNISIITCGVNTSKFIPLNKIEIRKKLSIDQNSKLVLFTGSLSYMKGVDLIFKCAQKMPDILFVFVGSGSMRSNSKNCMFLGPCPNDKMPMLMNSADILVLPSRSEGTPVVILEALSCGIPVISSKVGGCPDVIKDGKNGYLVPINNIDILQKKINFLLRNTNYRISMGEQGRKEMIERFDNSIIAQRIKKIYEITSKNNLNVVKNFNEFWKGLIDTK